MPNRRKPYLLKQAEGNLGHRTLKPPAHGSHGNFDPPFELPPDAMTEWNRVRAEAPWVMASEAGILAMRCMAWSQWLQMERDIQQEGHVLTTRSGKVKNPKIQFAREYRATVIKCDCELGLTTNSREKISQNAPEAVDPIDAAMFG